MALQLRMHSMSVQESEVGPDNSLRIFRGIRSSSRTRMGACRQLSLLLQNRHCLHAHYCRKIVKKVIQGMSSSEVIS